MDVEINSYNPRVKIGFCGSLGYYLFERGYDGNLTIIRQKRGLPTAAAVAASKMAFAVVWAITFLNAAMWVVLLTMFDIMDYE